MKSISPIVYERLTPRQRVIATVEAKARDDKDELKRLMSSCPKCQYLMTDAAYGDTLRNLRLFNTGVECDIRGEIIGYLFFRHSNPEAAKAHLQNIANLLAFRESFLKRLGIDPTGMAKAAELSHPLMNWLQNQLPSADPEFVQDMAAWMMKNVFDELG